MLKIWEIFKLRLNSQNTQNLRNIQFEIKLSKYSIYVNVQLFWGKLDLGTVHQIVINRSWWKAGAVCEHESLDQVGSPPFSWADHHKRTT
jgi:hypothetical protein